MDLRAEWNRVPVPSGDLREGWVAVSHRWVASRATRRLGYSGWVRITREDDARHTPIFRALRFAPNLHRDEASGTGDIALDWAAWITLSHGEPSEDAPLRLRVRTAHPWEVLYATLWHPDPTNRLAARLGFLGLLLGLASFI